MANAIAKISSGNRVSETRFPFGWHFCKLVWQFIYEYATQMEIEFQRLDFHWDFFFFFFGSYTCNSKPELVFPFPTRRSSDLSDCFNSVICI